MPIWNTIGKNKEFFFHYNFKASKTEFLFCEAFLNKYLISDPLKNSILLLFDCVFSFVCLL
jgi:hypothetical protein